ncbi:hypothetical protein [Pontibacter roseus]|uniref:hypothetical protein n=1 Tax=Pontibacter roseus TaxID=336989 RepID=UPI0003697CAF|nr:hypothetical protein [Pontibacter roseus]
MKNLKDILKTGFALAVVTTLTVSCGERPASDPADDTSTAEAITEKSKSTQNLNEPRPAPIGDTAVTGEQADQFGNLPPNVDSVSRERVELDKQRQLKENPNQRPKISTQPNRSADGSREQ